MVVEGAMNRKTFLAYVGQCLAPTRPAQRHRTSWPTTCSDHKGKGRRQNAYPFDRFVGDLLQGTTAESVRIEPPLSTIDLLAKRMDCRVKPGNDNRYQHDRAPV